MITTDSELEMLDKDVSGIKIKIPEGNRDQDLAMLVNSANSPPSGRSEQRQSIDSLMAYIERIAQEKEDEAARRDSEARQAEERWQDRQEKRSRLSRRAHSVTRAISSSMKEAFNLVLRVLIGGMKVLESVSFIASELTFQTHYQVALKAIMLFITVGRCPSTLLRSVYSDR